jgi:hypothetical protein
MKPEEPLLPSDFITLSPHHLITAHRAVRAVRALPISPSVDAVKCSILVGVAADILR